MPAVLCSVSGDFEELDCLALLAEAPRWLLRGISGGGGFPWGAGIVSSMTGPPSACSALAPHPHLGSLCASSSVGVLGGPCSLLVYHCVA